MPQAVRDFWLPRFRNFKVKFLFSANKMEGREVRTHSTSVAKKQKKKKKRTQKVEGAWISYTPLGVVVFISGYRYKPLLF
jgi:hypothetical protein